MLQLKGSLRNCFSTDGSEKYPSVHKIQLEVQTPLKNGDSRIELKDLSVPLEIYNALSTKVGSFITLPVGAFAQDNRIVFFFIKGANIKDIKVSQ